MGRGAQNDDDIVVRLTRYLDANSVSGYWYTNDTETDLELVSADANYDVISTSGVAKLYNCADTEAPASGVAMLTSAGLVLGSGGTARSKNAGSVSQVAGAKILPKGNTLAVGISGTMTGLVGCSITARFKKANA